MNTHQRLLKNFRLLAGVQNICSMRAPIFLDGANTEALATAWASVGSVTVTNPTMATSYRLYVCRDLSDYKHRLLAQPNQTHCFATNFSSFCNNACTTGTRKHSAIYFPFDFLQSKSIFIHPLVIAFFRVLGFVAGLHLLFAVKFGQLGNFQT